MLKFGSGPRRLGHTIPHMKILTANIALGLRRMDHLITNVRSLAAYHSWSSFLTAILYPPLRGRWGGPPYSSTRVGYLKKHSDLNATLQLISEADPDILVLNEIVFEIHKSHLDDALKQMEFTAIAYGLGGKYPDAHAVTLVAAKEDAAIIPAAMPQLPYPGCGGGIAMLRLKRGISVVGAHMALPGTNLWPQQLDSIQALIEAEKNLGNEVVFAGDCNETAPPITAALSKFNIISVDKNRTPTCPLSLPRIFQKDLDHIYIPNTWSINDVRIIPFGSDHAAVCAELSRSSAL